VVRQIEEPRNRRMARRKVTVEIGHGCMNNENTRRFYKPCRATAGVPLVPATFHAGRKESVSTNEPKRTLPPLNAYAPNE